MTADSQAASAAGRNTGIAGFRRFAITRPHLFRLTFERVTPDLLAERHVSKAARATYDALLSWIRRVDIGPRSIDVVAYQFHSLCQSLATSELQAQPPPIGSNFWPHIRGVGQDDIWRDALHAYLTGIDTNA